MNSNKFTECDMKSKNSDLKTKKPKNLTIQVFRFLKTLKDLGFLKWVYELPWLEENVSNVLFYWRQLASCVIK